MGHERTEPIWSQTFPSEVGNTPWLDFIRNFRDTCSDERNPFIDMSKSPETKLLHLNHYFDLIGSDGRKYPYVEEYWYRTNKDTSWSLDFAVYINNGVTPHRVLIECFTPELEAGCIQTFEKINVQ